MKKLLQLSTIVFMLIFAGACLHAQKADDEIAADHPKYVVFGNLDTPLLNNSGAELLDAIKQLYYDPIKNSPIGSDCIFANFDDAFFSQYDITKFEACIFPMGDKSLDYQTSGGISVIGKLMEIKAAGNCAIIIGRKLLSQGFSGSSQTKNFLTNIMGITDYSTHSLLSGGTYKLYSTKGVLDDPVGQAIFKQGNGKYAENGNWGETWVYRDKIEYFEMNETENKVATDWFSWETDNITVVNQGNTGQLIGCRAQDGYNMFILWTQSFDNYNSVGSIPRASTQLWQSLIWFADNRPHTDAYLKLKKGDLSFNGVAVGSSEDQLLEFSNTGVKDLVIDDIYIFEMEDPSIFQIVEGWDGNEITLKPGESGSLTIRFSPDEDREFNDFLYISSNSDGGKEDEVRLYGKGGEVIPDGAFYKFQNDSLFAKELGLAEKDTLVAVIQSVGTDNVTIVEVDIVDNPLLAFSFLNEEDSKTPIFIDVDKTHAINVLFVPLEIGETYTARLKVTSTNNLDPNKTSYVHLEGYATASGPIFTVSVDSVFYNGVNEVGETQEKTVTIWNTGDGDLEVTGLSIVNDADGVYNIKNPFDVPMTFKTSDDPYDLIIEFSPKEEKTYLANLKIVSNSVTNGDIEIPIRGDGVISGIKDPEVTSANGLLTLAVYPNPVDNNATIEYTLHSQSSKRVELFIVDMLGNKVKNFGSKMLVPGSQTINYDTRNLAAGNYTLIANIEGSTVRLSMVVVR